MSQTTSLISILIGASLVLFIRDPFFMIVGVVMVVIGMVQGSENKPRMVKGSK